MSAGVRTVLRGFGQLLITAGVVLLSFCVYELQVTTLYTNQKQHTLNRQLTDTWQRPHPIAPDAPAPAGPVFAAFTPGQGIARIYLPTLGKDQVHVLVGGCLARGPQDRPEPLPGYGAARRDRQRRH